MRACPRVRHARGLRARAHYAARDGWRARARAQKYSRGCGFVIPVSAGILSVAIFNEDGAHEKDAETKSRSEGGEAAT